MWGREGGAQCDVDLGVLGKDKCRRTPPGFVWGTWMEGVQPDMGAWTGLGRGIQCRQVTSGTW